MFTPLPKTFSEPIYIENYDDDDNDDDDDDDADKIALSILTLLSNFAPKAKLRGVGTQSDGHTCGMMTMTMTMTMFMLMMMMMMMMMMMTMMMTMVMMMKQDGVDEARFCFW